MVNHVERRHLWCPVSDYFIFRSLVSYPTCVTVFFMDRKYPKSFNWMNTNVNLTGWFCAQIFLVHQSIEHQFHMNQNPNNLCQSALNFSIFHCRSCVVNLFFSSETWMSDQELVKKFYRYKQGKNIPISTFCYDFLFDKFQIVKETTHVHYMMISYPMIINFAVLTSTLRTTFWTKTNLTSFGHMFETFIHRNTIELLMFVDRRYHQIQRKNQKWVFFA